MYVIFPADEVVYLSYGRLIVVPGNTNQETSNSPIRTSSLPLEQASSEIPRNTNHSGTIKRATVNDPLPGSSRIEYNLVEDQPSTSRGCNQTAPTQETKPKRRSLKLNFNLLKRSNSKNSDIQTPLSSRVRYSVGNREASITTPPSEAFKRFCNISGETNNSNQIPLEKSPKEKEKSPSRFNFQEKTSSKRSSSSSKNSKPPSIVQDDQVSKRSSKHSSSSLKSSKQDKGSPHTLPNHTSILKRSQSQIQRDTKKEPARKISTPTNLTAEAFYPLSTSREKNLVEPSPEPQLKVRSSSFRLSFRRSKTPDISTVPPPRPERKKEKKPPLKPKAATLERKLSFSDFLVVSRDRTTEIRPEVIVTSERETLRISREKSPVLGFFRKTPSPKNLGRDRTPHLSRDSGLYANQFLLHEAQIEDDSQPVSAGPTHASGEGSIMRVAIFVINPTNTVIISLALLTVLRLLILTIEF